MATIGGIREPLDIQISPDGKRGYVSTQRSGVVVFDAKTASVIARIRLPNVELRKLTLSPDGTRLTGTPNGRCLVITHTVPHLSSLMDVTYGELEVAQVPSVREPQESAIIGDRAYVTNHLSDSISVFNFGEPCTESKN